MSGASDWIVIRRAPDVDPAVMPPGLEGLWVDKSDFPQVDELSPDTEAAAVPTGRFETGYNGRVAEVYEIRP